MHTSSHNYTHTNIYIQI